MQDNLDPVKNKFKIEVVLLFITSLINLIVILTVGFLIGPQINKTYVVTKEINEYNQKNYDMNQENNKILKNFNDLLKKSRKTVDKDGK